MTLNRNRDGSYIHAGDPCPICKTPIRGYVAGSGRKTDDREVNSFELECGHRCDRNWRTGVFFNFPDPTPCQWYDSISEVCFHFKSCKHITNQKECVEFS